RERAMRSSSCLPFLREAEHPPRDHIALNLVRAGGDHVCPGVPVRVDPAFVGRKLRGAFDELSVRPQNLPGNLGYSRAQFAARQLVHGGQLRWVLASGTKLQVAFPQPAVCLDLCDDVSEGLAPVTVTL